MSAHIRSTLCALLVLASATAFAKADDKGDIKESVKSLAIALNNGDGPTAKKYVASDENNQKLVETLTKVTKANRDLQDAAVAKFGDEGKTLGGNRMGPKGPQFDKDFDDAQITVNGDTATVTGKTQGNGHAATFKKEGGTWKLDFLATAPELSQMGPQAGMMAKMADVMNETAGEIKDGKYSSVQEAKQAFYQKIAAAMGSLGRPGAGGPPH